MWNRIFPVLIKISLCVCVCFCLHGSPCSWVKYSVCLILSDFDRLAALKLLFRCYKSVCRILVYIKWSQMRIDRPLSECSVLWQREWIKIHPAPGRRSLWQRLLWRLQGRTCSGGCYGTRGNSPSGAPGEQDTWLRTEIQLKKWRVEKRWRRAGGWIHKMTLFLNFLKQVKLTSLVSW